tara:strand:+ start:9059 stop:9433 length:375 start_codon:yes stop_codon:yes gene_type:complete
MDYPKVLLVEDDLELSDVIKDHLSSMKCAVEIAPDGHQAIKMMENKKYTCLISDIRMPVMDGIEMIRKMRSLGIETPVIFMTGFSSYTAEEIADVGGVVLLEKPFTSEQLSEIVTGYIELLEAG